MLAQFLKPAFWVALTFAFVMAVLPYPPRIAADTPDKFQHILAFATLTALASAAWPAASSFKVGWRLSAFGVLIEIIQTIPALHRDADIWDWFADTVAVAAVLAVVFLVRRAPTGTERR